jgi:hypothetical protein
MRPRWLLALLAVTAAVYGIAASSLETALAAVTAAVLALTFTVDDRRP